MGDDDPRLRDAVDFILHGADDRALRIIGRALDRRSSNAATISAAETGAAAGDLALEMSQRVARQLAAAVDAGAMARNVVRQLILQNEPEMPADHLDVLLDAWVPPEQAPGQDADRSGQSVGGVEGELPPAAVMAMVTQFVSFSLGIMPPHEQRELPDGWSRRYWSAFSTHTQSLIKQLLTGQIEAAAFWRAVREHIGPVEGAGASAPG